jgi:hypothetical protein
VISEANDLSLDDHPTFPAPTAGRVLALAVQVLGLLRLDKRRAFFISGSARRLSTALPAIATT